MGCILGLGHQLEICIRVDVQVIVEGNISVQGGVDAACGEQLDGLFQRVDALYGGTIALGQFHVGGSKAVGGGLALQVLKGLDLVVVLAASRPANRLSQSLSTYSGSTHSFSAMARETSTS